ncbi:MAG: tetratricopeptide repeat protein [Nitrospina sp.]|nr:tetratricopeptide repeat protein [Nitrospina sp.]
MATDPKTSRKHLLKDPDPFYSASNQFMERLLVNKVPLAILLVSIVLIAAGLGIYQKQQFKKTLSMEELYFQMQQMLEKEKDASPDKILGDLKGKFGEFDEGKQKKRAHLLLADAYYRFEKYQEAEKEYREIRDNAGADLLVKDLARRGLAHVMEGKKDYKAAIEIYKSIIDNPGPLPVFYEYTGLARAYELSGDKENAKLILRDLTTKFPDHPDLSRVQLQLKQLEGGS